MTKIIVGNTYSLLENPSGDIEKIVDTALAVKTPGYFFSPAFKSGFWDGRTHFYEKSIGAFPTGLLGLVQYALEGTKYEIEDIRKDDRVIPIPTEVKLFEPEAEGGMITLRDYQLESVQEAIEKKRGIVNVATNGGKTEIAAGIIKQILPTLKKNERILFVTHSKEIFHQSAERLAKRLGIEVGKVGDGEWNEKPVTLCMIPTLSKYIEKPSIDKLPKSSYNREMKALKLIREKIANYKKYKQQTFLALAARLQEIDDTTSQNAAEIVFELAIHNQDEKELEKAMKKAMKALKDYEKKKFEGLLDNYNRTVEFLNSAICFIGDEAHHSSSSSWFDTLMLCDNAVYRYGLTGTIDKKDEINAMRLFGCMGDVLTKISNEFLIEQGFSAKPTIYLETIEDPIIEGKDYQEAYKKGIVENEYRNNIIVEKVAEKYEQGKGCLVIVSHIAHGEVLKKKLEEAGVECEFTNGSVDSNFRQEVLKDMKTGKLKVLIATNILDEGVDVNNINCLFMAAAGKSYRAILQRVGRGLRVKKDGSGLEVFDYLDYMNHYLVKHTLERYTYYKEEGFEIKKV